VAEISAKAVKELRDRTGAGMMECKKALGDASGDLDRAVTLLRERGLAKAGKREGRATSEGTVAIAVEGAAGGMIELACETDFVGRNDEFQGLARELAGLVAADAALTSPEALADATSGGQKVAERVKAAIGKFGENVVIRRVARLAVEGPGRIGGYVHAGGKLGVLVGLRTTGRGPALDEVAKDVAMHVAAADPTPLAIDRAGVPADVVAREREILEKQAQQSGKPAKVIEKIVEGRLNKFFGEVCLLEQPFVKDPDRSIGEVLTGASKQVGAEVAPTGFIRFKLGEAAES
jgi:elongation factor Ts